MSVKLALTRRSGNLIRRFRNPCRAFEFVDPGTVAIHTHLAAPKMDSPLWEPIFAPLGTGDSPLWEPIFAPLGTGGCRRTVNNHYYSDTYERTYRSVTY